MKNFYCQKHFLNYFKKAVVTMNGKSAMEATIPRGLLLLLLLLLILLPIKMVITQTIQIATRIKTGRYNITTIINNNIIIVLVTTTTTTTTITIIHKLLL